MQLPADPMGSLVPEPSPCTNPSASPNGLLHDDLFHNSPLDASSTATYTLEDLELLNHLENNVTEILVAQKGPGHFPSDTLIQNAFLLPYLMDAVLAISALHMSTLPQHEHRKAELLHRAAQLRDRALLASQTPDSTGESSIGRCLFNALSGLHSLFNTLSYSDHFSEFLDRFIQFIREQRKCADRFRETPNNVRESTLGPAWAAISEAGVATGTSRDRGGSGGGHECDELAARVEQAETMDPAAMEACRGAVAQLQWVHDMMRLLPPEADASVHVVMAWPSLIPESFVTLLEQRRPEALAILTHYAALLRSCNEVWIFGDSGSLLVRLIARHLGSYWESWIQPDI